MLAIKRNGLSLIFWPALVRVLSEMMMCRWQSTESCGGWQAPSGPAAAAAQRRRSASAVRQGRVADGRIHVGQERQPVAVPVRVRSRCAAHAGVRRRRVQLAEQRRQRVRLRRRTSAASTSTGVQSPVAAARRFVDRRQQQQRVRRAAVGAWSRDRMFTGVPTVRHGAAGHAASRRRQ